MVPDPAPTDERQTAEYKALIFVTAKLGEDVERIRAAIEGIHRPRPVATPEAAKDNGLPN